MIQVVHMMKPSIYLLIIATAVNLIKADEVTTVKPVETTTVKLEETTPPLKPNETAIAEAHVDFADGVEMQIKKVTGADGKEVSILLKKEVLSEKLEKPQKTRRRRNVVDIVATANNEGEFHKEKLKDVEGNEVEVLIKEEVGNRRKRSFQDFSKLMKDKRIQDFELNQNDPDTFI